MPEPSPRPGPRPEPAREQMRRVVETTAPRRKNPFLPDDAPFIPLGNLDGTGIAILDSHNAYQEVKARDVSRNNQSRFFSGAPGWLVKHYPRIRKGQNSADESDTWRPEIVTDMILNACAWEGPFEPKDKLRGRGPWLGEDGDLVLHCGNTLWIDGRLLSVGRRGERIYPALPPMMRPHASVQDGAPGDRVLDRLLTWHWRRPALDPLLLLGWIASAYIGGALDVRPAVWMTGLKNAGKSTLTQTLKCLFGNGTSVLHSTDTTAAGIYQTLRHDSIPVVLDETEPSMDNRRLDNLVGMMRNSYSGGDVQRGSSEGSAHQFPVRNPFLFASINTLPMKAQDRSRCAILELEPLKPGSRLLFDMSEMHMLGRCLLRRIADQWEPLRGEIIPAYREALIARGWDNRGADTVGILLACACALRFDRDNVLMDMDDCGLDLEEALALQKTEEAPDYMHVIDHLRGYLADSWRGGERRPLGELIRQAAGLGTVPASAQTGLGGTPRSDAEAVYAARHDETAHDAQKALMLYGLKVVEHTDDRGRSARFVAVANHGAALQTIFRETHWAGVSGTSGGWRPALARAPGACAKNDAVYFRDGKHRAVLVPLSLFLGEDDAPADADDGAPVAAPDDADDAAPEDDAPPA